MIHLFRTESVAQPSLGLSAMCDFYDRIAQLLTLYAPCKGNTIPVKERPKSGTLLYFFTDSCNASLVALLSRATHYNVITEIYKALITIVRKTISFFALKVQHNLTQGKCIVCATPWVNTAYPLYAPCKGNTLKSNALHDIRPTFRNRSTEVGHSLVFFYRLL